MDRQKPINWRIMAGVAVADIVIGLVLASMALSGMLGDGDQTVLAAVGGLLMVIGLGLFLWARNNLSKSGNRRGDLN
jgi:EamA domain-containing membrane protein RarD